MRELLLVWHDRDGSRTTHEFDDIGAADAWLRSVLGEVITSGELKEAGYADDGIGRLCYYSDEGLDEVGSIEAYLDGQAVTPDALRD